MKIPRRLERHVEAKLNGHRLYRLLALTLTIITGLTTLTGCGALKAGQSGTGTVNLGNSSLDFGPVVIGSTKTLSDTITNNTSSDVTIASIQGAGSGFQISGVTMPLTVAAGQTVSFNVQFQAASKGSATVTISFQDQNSQGVVSLTATAQGVTLGQLSANPSQIAFGNTQVGTNQTASVILTNIGGSDLTITAATMSGAGFSLTGFAPPVTLQAGFTTSLTIIFAPPASGSYSGSVTLATTSDNQNSNFVISFTGAGVMPGTLSANPSSVAFGNVQVGTSSSKSETLTNTGSTAVTISQATVSGTGYSISGLTLPTTLNSNQSVTFTVKFAPTSAGASNGSVSVVSDASNSPLSISLSGTGVAAGQLGSNPSSFSFGNVQVGTSKSLSGTLTNSGGSSLTISAASASGSGFSLSGLSLPLTLNAGQSTSFTVLFSPSATGAASGNVNITSNGGNPNLNIPLSGAGVTQGTLTPNPSSLAFGNVQVGNTSSLAETLTNSGGTSLTISAASASGTGFSLSGLSLPLTLNAGQSTSFNVTFAPSAAGSASGNVTITSNGSDSTLTIGLSGTGVTQGILSPNPSSLGFGNVQVGSSASLSETLTNTGGSSVTISAANATGTGFSMSGLSLPLTLNAGQSTSFTVKFAPTAGGASSGSVSITSNGGNPNLSIALSGTGVTLGTLSPNPSSLGFGNVQVGNSSNLSETIANTGGSAVTISQASVTGAGFSISGLTTPLTLNVNQRVTFTATFTPASAGAASGNLSITSNASNSPLTIGLSGTGTAAGTLGVSPTSLSFGNVAVGSNSALNGSLTASGAAVTVTSASINNAEFVLSGISLPATIGAGQSAGFTVTFTPQATGATSASLTFTSNASNSPTTQTMTGTGTTPAQHSVDLTWNVSSGAVGYNIYRSTVSGGPYTMINASLDATNAYTDSTVTSGQTYYYVATEVNAQSQESGYSNQVQAVIPTP